MPGEPLIICSECREQARIAEAVSRSGNEVWFRCPKCGYRERVMPKDAT